MLTNQPLMENKLVRCCQDRKQKKLLYRLASSILCPHFWAIKNSFVFREPTSSVTKSQSVESSAAYFRSFDNYKFIEFSHIYKACGLSDLVSGLRRSWPLKNHYLILSSSSISWSQIPETTSRRRIVVVGGIKLIFQQH